MPRVRSVPCYRPELAWLAALIGVVVALGVVAEPGGASPPSQSPSASISPVSSGSPRRVGMNSCAARGCHGAVGEVDPAGGDVYLKGGASTTWLHFDPHARAYDVLLEPRSIAIAAKLEKTLGTKNAHEAGLCLACHATVSPPESIRQGVSHVRDGVTCESCHGPAEVWQESHVSAGWMKKSAAEKKLDGMTDLSKASGRASTCVGCHVGDRSRGMDMNHDLIAAGHPRLNFEYSSYMASYPKHWKEETADRADFESKSWAVGQLVTAKAVLQLLVDRALASEPGAVRKAPAPEAVWPEFSESECFACHHELTRQSPLQSSEHVKLKPGNLPWATWPLAMMADLENLGKVGLKLDPLREEMAKLDPDPALVAKLATSAIPEVDKLIVAIETGALDKDRLKSLIQEIGSRNPDPRLSWDLATQTYLTKLALIRAGLIADDPSLRSTFDLLKFPEVPQRYDSPRSRSGVSPTSP